MEIQEIKNNVESTVKNYFTENKYKIIGVGMLLCLLLCGVYIMFCGQNIDNGSGAEIIDDIRATGNNIQEASKQLDSVANRIDRSSERISNVQERINGSAERVENIKGRNNENQELVSESIKLTAEARTIIQNLSNANGEENKSSN